jgi:hypothetical protein
MKYIWLVIGSIFVVAGIVIMLIDWSTTASTDTNIRTYSDLTSDIICYSPGRTLNLGTTDWPCYVTDTVATFNPNTARVIPTVDTYSGRVYVKRTAEAPGIIVSTWGLNMQNDPRFSLFNSSDPGYTLACLFRYNSENTTDFLRFQVGFGSMRIYSDRVASVLLYQTSDTTHSWSVELGSDVISLTTGDMYIAAFVLLPFSDDGNFIQMKHIILHVSDTFDVTTVLDGTPFNLPGTDTYTRPMFKDMDARYDMYAAPITVAPYEWGVHACIYLSTPLDVTEMTSLSQQMILDSLLPGVDYGGAMTFYKNNAISRMPTVRGTPTTVSGVAAPFAIAADGRITGTSGVVTESPVTVSVQVDKAYNLFSLTYNVLPEPVIIYPISYIGNSDTIHTIVPTNLLYVEVVSISPALPAGMQLVTFDTATEALVQGTIYGAPNGVSPSTEYTITVNMPDPVGDDDPLSLSSESRLTITLEFVAASALLPGMTKFSYGTSVDNPLILFAGYYDKVFNGEDWREFLPSDREDFDQFQATLPVNLKLNYDTGAIEGYPETAIDGIQPVIVRATSKTNRIQYEDTLYIRIVKNMNVLNYETEYVITPGEDMVIQPNTDGVAKKLTLGESWPDGTMSYVDGTIVIPKDQLPSSDLRNLSVEANTVDKVITQSTSLISDSSVGDPTWPYYVGGTSVAVGAGMVGWGIYDLNRTFKPEIKKQKKQ